MVQFLLRRIGMRRQSHAAEAPQLESPVVTATVDRPEVGQETSSAPYNAPTIVEKVERELLVESGSLVGGLERVIGETPPPPAVDYYFNAVSINAGKIEVSTSLWATRVNIPFTHSTYDEEQVTRGLIELLKVAPSLANHLEVTVGTKPTLRFVYITEPGQMLSSVHVGIDDWLPAFSITNGYGGPFRRIFDSDNNFDLRFALKVTSRDSSDAAVAALRGRLSHEAGIRGMPVRQSEDGTIISFGLGQNLAITNEVLLREELARRPTYLCLYGSYEREDKSLLSLVTISQEQLTIGFWLSRASLQTHEQTQEKADVLRRALLTEQLLQSPIELATGTSLIAELKQPWRVTYHYARSFQDELF